MKRLALILTIVCLSLWTLSAQYIDYDFFVSTDTTETSEQPYLFIDYLSYFKNNEYPVGIIDGYTLIGNKLSTGLMFKPSDKISFTAGAVYNKFFWTDSTFFQPLLRLDAAFGKFHIIMGNIYPGAFHRMLSQIYDQERIMTYPTEHGIQLLYSDSSMRLETWLDWWRFIFYGSPHPENFHVGMNYNIKILHIGSHHYYLNFQNIFAHTGGEIDSSSAYTVTIMDYAIGLIYRFEPTQQLSSSLAAYKLAYSDLTKTHFYPFQNGSAWLVKANMKFFNYAIQLQMWNSKTFICPTGEMYYLNYNFYNNLSEPEKKYYSIQFDYTKRLKYFRIKTGFFIFPTSPRINYGYYLYMRFILNKKLKFNAHAA